VAGRKEGEGEEVGEIGRGLVERWGSGGRVREEGSRDVDWEHE